MTRLEALVLSYFDAHKGPVITHILDLEGRNAPTKLPLDVRKEITKFIDMQTAEKFFTYGFKNYTSANLYFEIPSNLARGNREILCLTALTRSGKPEVFKETLFAGANRLKTIPNLYMAFHDNLKDPEVTQKQRELKEFLAILCQELNRAREMAITHDSARESKRNWIRDQKRDRDRDDARDRQRDEVRDRERDEARDIQHENVRDHKGDTTSI